MLFLESKTAAQAVAGDKRLDVLERLQEKGLIPLIRSARLNCFEQALLTPQRVPELERALAAWTEAEDNIPYVRGDLFCFEDFVLFLIFSDGPEKSGGMRAGIIHEAETTEPLKKLDAFCRNVSDALEALGSTNREEPGAPEAIEWKQREPRAQSAGAAQFTAAASADSLLARREIKPEHARAIELLENMGARRLLHRIREAHPDGRLSDLLSGDENGTGTEGLINRLAGVGLLRREMLISCRKVGRPLFSLPPETLSVITASNAVCSECGASISDEKVEELVKPTETAATLLEDSSWLINRLYSTLREVGIAEKDIKVGQTTSDGESQMMVNVCNEPFLFVLKDGDLTPNHTRRAFDKLIETGASHLVLIATGEIQDEARVRLREQARRRARSGNGVEVIFIEGVETVAAELQQAFERISQRALTEELCELDTSLGFSIGYMVATRFRLMRNKPAALTDLAESAVGALAGSLREI